MPAIGFPTRRRNQIQGAGQLKERPIREGGEMLSSRRSIAVVAIVAAAMLASVGTAAGAEPADEHCVVEVVDQLESGEFVLSDPVCFVTFAEAAWYASSGVVILESDTTPSDLTHMPVIAGVLSTFTLGVHYDGYSGGGSSISVVGSSCSGGYWNTPPAWDNRISSTWNGCPRIKHHDLPNKGGSYASTYGVGSVHNVPARLDNRAESISYWSS
jgi:hypothetical protein